jgi:hypothetical protein
MGVDGIIYGSHKGWEVDMEPIIVTNEPTSIHLAMSTKGVQWYTKGWNMEDIPDSNNPSIKKDFDGTNTRHRGMCVVSQCNILRSNWLVGGEGIIVWPHVFHCT